MIQTQQGTLKLCKDFLHLLSLKPQSSSPCLLFCPGFFSFSAIPQCLTWHNPARQERCPVAPTLSLSLFYQNTLTQGSLGCQGISLTVLHGNKCITACERAQTDHKLHGLSHSRHQHSSLSKPCDISGVLP